MSKDDQKLVSSLLGTRVIAYQPGLTHFLGSVEESIILFQLLYWQGKGRDSYWIYKSVDELEHETGITRNKQKTAIDRLIKKGFLEKTNKGLFNRRNFHVPVDKLCRSILTLHKKQDLVDRETSRYFAEIQPTQKEPKSTQRLKTKEYVHIRNELKEKLTPECWKRAP